MEENNIKNDNENQIDETGDTLEKIKQLIYKKYGLGALTVYARMHKLNYQELSNVLGGRSRNAKIIACLEKEFKTKI